MAESDIYQWPLPNLGGPPNGPLNLRALAVAAENTLADKSLTTYPVAWKTSGVQPGNPSELIGRYKQVGAYCWVYIWMRTGSGQAEVPGTGDFSFSLPMPHVAESTNVQPSEDALVGKAYYGTGETWPCLGLITPNTDQVRPLMPASTTKSVFTTARRIAAASEPNTAVPYIPGWVYGFPANSNILMMGTYRVA